MGVFIRPESSFFWLFLEGVRRKEATRIPICREGSPRTQRAARQAAEALYLARMVAIHSADPLPPRLLTVPQAADYLGVSAETMNKYAARGVVPVVMLPPPRAANGGPFIDRWDLDRLVERTKERHDRPAPVARGARGR